MAADLFGHENPIGRRIAQTGSETRESGEIVGVVSDVRSISPDPLPVTFQVYQPIAQEPQARHEIAVRTSGVAPAALIDGIRAVIAELDPDLPVRDLNSANARIDRYNYQLGVLRDVLSLFALLGLGLASIGIYGVIARLMAQRTGEFGIRLALGANVRDIVGIVLASGVKLALVGSTLGALGAFGISRILTATFPGMRLESVSTLAGAIAVLIAVALVACYVPARKASRINPVTALRAE